MKIVIINSSQLNECWSALQYTDNCVLCDKVTTCKVKSRQHKNGLVAKLEHEKQRIVEEQKLRLDKIQSNILEAMRIFN